MNRYTFSNGQVLKETKVDLTADKPHHPLEVCPFMIIVPVLTDRHRVSLHIKEVRRHAREIHGR